MDLQTAGRVLAVIGAAMLIIGLLMVVGGRIGLGSLPGDVQYRGERWSCYLPITTMLLISVALTIIVNLIWRWFR
jgi:hypothetical protein